MLYFDIRSLEARAETVDGCLEAADPVWIDADTRPDQSGVHVTGRLSSAGNGRFYFSGHLNGVIASTCRRCLIDVDVPVQDDMQLLFASSELVEADEDDVFPLPPNARTLDLRPAVREEWLLAVPTFALCREDCLGLCPTCGADRNSGACTCASTTDPRWEKLRASRDVIS